MILGVLFSDALENGTPFKSYYYLSKAAELFIHFPFPVVDGFKLIEKTLHSQIGPSAHVRVRKE